MTIPQFRAPIVSVEFDSTRAFQGPSVLRYKTLYFGQRTSAGTVAVLTLARATSADQAGKFWGVGSHLHLLAIGHFATNKVTEFWGIALADNGSTFATGTFTVAGTPTAAG